MSLCACTHGSDRHYVDYGLNVGTWLGKCLEDGCPCKLYSAASSSPFGQGGGPKKMMEFPQEQWNAWSSGYIWGQRSIADTLVMDEKAKYEHVMGLLRDSKMTHGQCQPRSRKACTACNAQDELDRLTSEWKGFTLYATSSSGNA